MLVSNNLESLVLSPSKRASIERTIMAVEKSSKLLYTRYAALSVNGIDNDELLKEMWLELANQGAPVKYLGTIPGIVREGNVIRFTSFHLRISSSGTIKLFIPLSETEKFEACYKIQDYLLQALQTNAKFKVNKRTNTYNLSFTRKELLEVSGLLHGASIDVQDKDLSIKLHKLSANFEGITNIVGDAVEEDNAWL